MHAEQASAITANALPCQSRWQVTRPDPDARIITSFKHFCVYRDCTRRCRATRGTPIVLGRLVTRRTPTCEGSSGDTPRACSAIGIYPDLLAALSGLPGTQLTPAF